MIPAASAEPWSQRALSRQPMQLEPVVARAGVLVREGQAMEAIALLEQALRRHSHDGRVWAALGWANLRAGRVAQARSQLENAMLLLPPEQAGLLRKQAEALLIAS